MTDKKDTESQTKKDCKDITVLLKTYKKCYFQKDISYTTEQWYFLQSFLQARYSFVLLVVKNTICD